MALAVAGTETNSGGDNVSSLTFAWNNSASATVLIVGTANRNLNLSTIAYNGGSMTSAVSLADGGQSAIYYLLSPDSGNNNVVITNAGSNVYIGGYASGWTGNDVSDPIGASNSQRTDAGNPSTSITTEQANSVIFDAMSAVSDNPSVSVGAGQTQLLLFAAADASKTAAGSRKASTTVGSYAMAWTASGTCTHVVAELKAAASVATGNNFFMGANF